MQMDQLAALLAFNSIPKLTPADASRILAYYQGDAIEAWRNYREWSRLRGFTDHMRQEVEERHQLIDPERLLNEYLSSGCSVLAWPDADYPTPLRHIYDPPLLLFYRGSLPSDDDLCLSIIGSRQATPYGRQVAELFAADLAAQGAVIVSGMARGIDSIGHRAALSVGGRTVAVLGSGLDVIYPRENEKLYAEICAHGAVISEFPLGTPALARNFPRRNRIISGLSRGIIVVEAGEKSGTLGTVNFAAQQGKDVFAVPGNITSPTSRGVNRMIRDDGVQVALSPQDVWDEYSTLPMIKPVRKARGGRSEEAGTPQLPHYERRLLEILLEPQQLDVLASRSDLGLDAAALNSTLMMMELRGLIRKLPGNYYQTIIKHIRA